MAFDLTSSGFADFSQGMEAMQHHRQINSNVTVSDLVSLGVLSSDLQPGPQGQRHVFFCLCKQKEKRKWS